MAKFTKIVTRRRMEDETPTPKVAIRNFCLECVGYSPSEVEHCTSKVCWLYPWRFGKTPLDLKSNRSVAHLRKHKTPAIR